MSPVIQAHVPISSTLKVKLIKAEKAPLPWRIKNWLRWGFLWGYIASLLSRGTARLTGNLSITSELKIRVYRAGIGKWIDYGVVSRRVVTSAGVGFLVDAWQNLVELENMKYHGCGTGTNGEASGDTALQTESTTILTVNSTRATGTQSEAAANIIQSQATQSFDGAGAITEHGLFDQAATGGGVLWDRSVFLALNVDTGDSIQFTYQATFTAGS